MATEKVCIIGAGSSGITAAKVLAQHGVPFDCFEKGTALGGNWRYRNDNGMSASYASLHINTSKTRMAYSDFPMPEDYPDYPHHSQILDYFESYVDRFGIRPRIRFRTEVREVRPAPSGGIGGGNTAPSGGIGGGNTAPSGGIGGRNTVAGAQAAADGWDVTFADLDSGEEATGRYAAVMVCNGHHWDPKLPDFPGNFEGRMMHAHAYETPAGLEDKNVLVVGIGNSAVDIACEASRVAARTFLSTRRSAHLVPKYVWGIPVDTITTPLGSRLPIAVQNVLFTLILNLARGPQTAFGLPLPKHRLLQAHPTVSADLLNLIGHGRIRIKPDLERLCGGAVRFADGSEEDVDVVICATGYKVTFPFFRPQLVNVAENEIRLYRQVVHPDLSRLYFIGLLQPLGAIMPLAEIQSEWVARLLTGECALPERAAMVQAYEKDRAALRRRYVKSTRHTIQADFFPYLARIKKEIRRGRRLARRKPGPAPAWHQEERALAESALAEGAE